LAPVVCNAAAGFCGLAWLCGNVAEGLCGLSGELRAFAGAIS
jgi:hypothetical protein